MLKRKSKGEDNNENEKEKENSKSTKHLKEKESKINKRDHSHDNTVEEEKEEKEEKETIFQISTKDITTLIDGYRSRSSDNISDLETIQQSYSSTENISAKLKVNLSNGINNNEIDDRINEFGSNQPKPIEIDSFWTIVWNALKDTILRILLLASIVSIIIGVITAPPEEKALGWIDGFGILIAVIVVVLVSSINDYNKQKQFADLNKTAESSKKVTVLRNGHWQENIINESEIVVGDIVKLEAGSIIPADGIIIECKEVKIDESALTGESKQISKNKFEICLSFLNNMRTNNQVINDLNLSSIPSPIILSGTQLSNGEGYFLVLAVGSNSCAGRIFNSLGEGDDEKLTPLQKKLEVIASKIGWMGLIVAILTVAALLIRFFIGRGINGGWASSDVLLVIEYILLGITVLVVAIPEGLPLAVTIALAFSVKKMYEQNNLVKQLISCETMGGATNICSDKTGTLTENIMKVFSIYYLEDVLYLHDEEKAINKLQENEETFKLFKECLISNCTASEQKGSATEIAIIKLMKQLKIDYQKEQENIIQKDYIRFHYDSNRKKMSTILKHVRNDNSHILHIKGAPEIILDTCEFIHTNQGIRQMNSTDKESIISICEEFNKKALRTIGFGYRILGPNEGGPDHSDKDENGKNIVEESKIVFFGLLGIRDSVRKGVPESVKICQRAGITVRMVTGDNLVTAKAIAQLCNIYDADDPDKNLALEGKEFHRLLGGLYKCCKKCKTRDCDDDEHKKIDKIENIEEFKKIKDKLRVIARSRPEDKYLLVTALKELDEVVAVTGDGTNDAPALKKANVGFAMGIAGTPIAQKAAHIVLLDDNFSSIVIALKWGRNIYLGIKKFIQFQITVNLVALASAFVGSVIIQESPLTPIQLLWVNLVMDSLGSLVLATDSPNEDIVKDLPYKKNDFIITKIMMKHIIGQSIYHIIVLFVILFAGTYFIPEDDFSVSGIPFSFNGKIRSGFRFAYNGYEDLSETNLENVTQYSQKIYHIIGPSRHLTIFFTTFIFLQLFNEINCRKVNDELNIFQGMIDNWVAIIIWIIEVGLSAIFIEFGRTVFQFCIYGLNWYQWLIILAFILFSGILRFILAFTNIICFEAGQQPKLEKGKTPIAEYIRQPSYKRMDSKKKETKKVPPSTIVKQPSYKKSPSNIPSPDKAQLVKMVTIEDNKGTERDPRYDISHLELNQSNELNISANVNK